MANTKNYGLSGVSTDVEFGVDGLRIISDGTAFKFRNATDTANVEIKAADPTGDDSVATRGWVERRYDVSATGQIDGTSPPAVVNGAIYMCTTSGGAYTAGYLYRGESGSWVEIIPYNGMRIVVTTALTGGTLQFLGDHMYLWDGDTSVWVDVGPYVIPGQFIKSVRTTLVFNSAGTVNIGSAVPANARPFRVIINSTQAFNGAPRSRVAVGDAGNTSRLAATGDSNLNNTNVHVTDCYYNYGVSTQLTATYTANGATQGQAYIEVLYTTA